MYEDNKGAIVDTTLIRGVKFINKEEDAEGKEVIASILEIPDPHFYDKNIGSTVGYADESLEIMKAVIQACEEHNITHTVWGGDIFHARLAQMEFFAEICKGFDAIQSMGINVYSAKGNHDMSAKFKYSFFDLLVDLGLISSEKKFSIGENNEVTINIFDYANSTDEIKCGRDKNNIVNIGVYHNNIVEIGVCEEEIIGPRIDPEKTSIFDNIDVAILNHIHSRMGDRVSLINGKAVRLITPGSVGRTGSHACHMREDAVLPKITIYDDYSIGISYITIFLTPTQEFFDLKKIIEMQRSINNFKEFSSNIESLEITFESVESTVAKMADVDDKIKVRTINYLKQVD